MKTGRVGQLTVSVSVVILVFIILTLNFVVKEDKKINN